MYGKYSSCFLFNLETTFCVWSKILFEPLLLLNDLTGPWPEIKALFHVLSWFPSSIVRRRLLFCSIIYVMSIGSSHTWWTCAPILFHFFTGSCSTLLGMCACTVEWRSISWDLGDKRGNASQCSWGDGLARRIRGLEKHAKHGVGKASEGRGHKGPDGLNGG